MPKPVLSDSTIAQLLTMPKVVANPGARWKDQKGSKQRTYRVESSSGDHHFTLFLRQNLRIRENFSCGLYYLHASGEKVTLTRYNGCDHPHYNPVEGSGFRGECHIHRATERYMELGRKEEHFAEPTRRYMDLGGALRALLEDCNISGIPLPEPPADEQQLGMPFK